MSHRESITVGPSPQGKFFNIASKVRGKKVGHDEAVQHALKTKSLGKSFDSVDEAVKAAKVRSKKSVTGLIAHEGLSRKKIRRSG